MQQHASADDRHISAFVLVESSDRIESLRRTIGALKAQKRPVDRIIVGAHAACPNEILDFLEGASSGEPADTEFGSNLQVDSFFTVEGEPSLSRMADLFLRANSECAASEEDDAQREADREEAELAERVRDTEGARDFTLLRATGGAASTPRRGRRARTVDHDQRTREVEKTAQEQALIPERLRAEGARRTAGRRRASVEEDQRWLWFLTADSSPTATTLADLVSAIDKTPTLAMVGPKRLAVEDVDQPTSRIVDLGITLTRSNRMVTSVEPGEIDQGQADWRSDVLAVALPGVLVREDTFNRLGGFDSRLTRPWPEIDLSQRVWRSGERVQVVPTAAAYTSLESVDESISSDFRTSQVLTLLKFRSLPWALLTLISFPLVTLGRVIRGIVRHDTSTVFREIAAFFRVMLQAPGVIFSGRKGGAEVRVSRQRLAPLFMPWSVAARERLDSWWTYLFSDDERSRNIRRTTWGISGTHHGIDDADYGRHTLWTIIVAAVSTAAGIAAARTLMRPGQILGGALVPPSQSTNDARDAIFSSWIPASLGSAGPSDPFARLMGHVPIEGGTFIVGLYLAIVPVTALIAWYSVGTISRSVVVRVLATVMWVSAPPFVHAFAEGRWTMLVVHALIPLAAQCLARAIGLPHKVSQASIAAAAGGGLIVGVISSIQPVIGLLMICGLLLVVPFVPGRRKRLWWCAVPTIAALLPNALGYVRHPESLLTPAGMPFAFTRASGIDMLMFSPSAFDPAAAALGIDPTWWTPVLAAAPLLVAVVGAMGAPMLMHTAGVAGRIAILATAGAFACAFVCGSVVVGVDGSQPFFAYPGGALSLAAAAVVTGFVCTADAVVRRARAGGRSRVLVARVSGIFATVVCGAVVAAWVIQAPQMLQVSPSTSPRIPAVASDIGHSAHRGRTLVLEQDASGIVTAEIVNNGGLSLDQVSSQYLAHRADEVEKGQPYDGALEALVTAAAQNVGATSTQSTSASLSEFGIAYVVVPGNVDSQAQLVDTLNRSPRFEQVTVSETGGMWRVVDPASRVTVTNEAGAVTRIASERTQVNSQLSADPSARTLALAERADPRWRATLGGKELAASDSGAWGQEFSIPAGAGGELKVFYSTPLISTLIIAGYVAVAVSALVAIPWKRRKEHLG